MHFKDDRVDRDTLEPAARRVDELMNMFASSSNDPERVALWSSEIQGAIDKVPNPKASSTDVAKTIRRFYGASGTYVELAEQPPSR